MTTTNEVMRLMHIADEFAVATGRNLTGDAFRSRAALSTVVEALVSERDAARAALAPAVPQWIPVSELLPEKCVEVLIFFAGQCSIASTGQYTGSKHDIGGWCYPAENRDMVDEDKDPLVTHWMPLPAAPSAKEPTT